MIITVGDFLRHIIDQNIPMNAEIWIEYPERYGLCQPENIEQNIAKNDFEDDADFIESFSIGNNREATRLYIFHHY